MIWATWSDSDIAMTIADVSHLIDWTSTKGSEDPLEGHRWSTVNQECWENSTCHRCGSSIHTSSSAREGEMQEK